MDAGDGDVRLGNDGTDPPNSELQSRREAKAIRTYKLGKTILLVIVWICLGMIHAIGSPTLPEMRDRLNTTMEKLSLAFGFRNFGALLGSVLLGMMADRYRKKANIVMGLAVILSGFPEIFKPHVRSLPVLGVLSFCTGVGQGGLESVGVAMVHWLWGDSSDASFHALHFGYPVGTVLAPLIAMPFLGSDVIETNSTNVCDNGVCFHNVTNSTVPFEPARIEIPFAIVGSLTCLVGIIFLLIACLGVPRGLSYHGVDKSNFLEVFSPKSCRAMGSTGYTCSILILVCLFYIFLNAKDGSLSTFVFAYAIESDLHFKKREAATLDTIYRLVEALGRAIAVVVAHYCPIQPMIIISVYVNAAFTTCLALLGTRSKINLWVFACLFKLTAAPIWPSGLAWTSKYIAFSSMVVAVTQVALGVTGYFFDWMGGHLYDISPGYFIYYGMACSFVLVVLITTMQVVASCCASREQYQVERPESDQKDDTSSPEVFHMKF